MAKRRGRPVSAPITILGRLAKEPELRFSASGIAMCIFTVVSSSRRKQPDGSYEDVDTTFWDCVCWRQLAENIAECAKGDRVIVTGKCAQEEWIDKETGQKRRKFKIKAEDVGMSMLFTTAKSGRLERGGTVLDADPWAA